MNPVELDFIQRRLAALPVGADPSAAVLVGGQAAVALVFRESVSLARGPDLLFIRRAEDPRDPWSGHMAFPGGHHEDEDPDLRATVERETREELGLDLASQAALMGRLRPVYTLPGGRPRLAVFPHVYRLRAPAGDHPALRPNAEVADIFWFPLNDLLAGGGRSTMTWIWRGVPLRLPCIRIQDQVIWGLSLRMLDGLLALLR